MDAINHIRLVLLRQTSTLGGFNFSSSFVKRDLLNVQKFPTIKPGPGQSLGEEKKNSPPDSELEPVSL